MKNKHLLIIAGPTAVGKTELSIKLAKLFNTEIISSDSRQFFKEMDLGTAKPTTAELAQVPHHFIDNLSIHEDYDVRKFEYDAISLLDKLFKNHDVVMMTGGSGLYIEAVCRGFDDIPHIDVDIRRNLMDDYKISGIAHLQDRLKEMDPEYYNLVDTQNPQRLMRALEVCIGTGKPFSSFRNKKQVERPFNIIKIGIERERAELYARIDRRMERMVEQGLFEEAKALYPVRHLNALQTVGYSEIFGFLDGLYNKEEAIRLLKRNSRRYAKRQMTWFRKDPSYVWFHPDQAEGIVQYICQKNPSLSQSNVSGN